MGSEVVAIAAISLAAGLGSFAVWATYRLITRTDSEAAASIRLAETTGRLERTSYELTVTRNALSASRARANILEEELAHEFSAANPNLAPNDVRSRVLRIARRWASSDTGDTVPATGNSSVPDVPAAESSRSSNR